MALTDTAVRQARPNAKAYKLTDGRGLLLLVQPNGAKLWRQRYRFAGKEQMLSLGTYPEVSLSMARDRRDAARRQLAEGMNPSATRNPAKTMSENTINDALRTLGYTGEEMTGHGFRTVASTLLNEDGAWRVDAIERQLSHHEDDEVRGAYNGADYLAERRQMMQAYADHLEVLREKARGKRFKAAA